LADGTERGSAASEGAIMAEHDDERQPEATKKSADLDPHRERGDGEKLTTNQGLRVDHTDDSLKAGPRGPTLMEDFHFREKMTHFDHERIPSAWCTPAAPGRTGSSRCTGR
jgi:hypothetical protein